MGTDYVATLTKYSTPDYGQPSLLLIINLSTHIPFLVFLRLPNDYHKVYNKIFLQTLVEAPLSRLPLFSPSIGACLQLLGQLD